MTRGAEERGRETFASTGRGGAGNAVRSPSRGRVAETTPEEAKAAAAYHENQKHVHAGRGGAGNLRSPSRDPKDRAKYQEMEKQEHQLQSEAIKRDQFATHSSGRGGIGNMSHATHTSPRDESPRGRENVVSSAIRSISRSRSREPRSSSATRPDTGAAAGDKLASVDEGASTVNGDSASTVGGGGGNSSTNHGHGSLASKIASHIPGLHSHAK